MDTEMCEQLISCTLAVVLLFVGFYLSLNTLWNWVTAKYSSFYCPSNIPIFGSSLYLEKDPVKVVKQVANIIEKGHGWCLFWLSWKPIILSETVECASAVLSSQKLIQKSFFYHFFHEWLGTGLLTSDGSKWKNRRRLLTPSFHFSILNEFAPIFESTAKRLVENLNTASLTCNQKAFDIQHLVRRATLEAMMETSMGVNIEKDENASRYRNAVHNMNELLHYRERSPWLWPKFMYSLTASGRKYYENLKCIHDYTNSAIEKRMSLRKLANLNSDSKSASQQLQKLCFIDTLLDSYMKGEIDISGIREEVDTFIFEGHDTTAAAISFCLYNLGRNINHQKTLQQEIDSTDGSGIYEIICNMKFLDLVLKESLRLCPPVPLVARCLTEDTVINGKTIYKGTDVGVGIGPLHRLEKYWTNPNDFNPYRFTENVKREPYSYVPFSAGPRNCIGQRFAILEAKISLYYVLKVFNIKAVQHEEEIEITAETIMRSRNGILIQFEKRLPFDI